jgi:hypothetical protein
VISCSLSKLLVKTVYERRRGEVGKWEVGKWGSGEVGKWGSGEVGKWGSEEMGRINRVC